MFRLLIGSLFAAILMFCYGFVHWGVLSPLVRDAFPYTRDLAADSPVVEAIESDLTETGTGTYVYPPYPKEKADEKEFFERSSRGPQLIIHFREGGIDLQSPAMFIMGFAQLFVSALVLGMLMRAAALPRYVSRVCFAMAIGFFAALFLEGTNVIWFFHSWELPMYNAAYHVATALAGGIVLALFTKPKVESKGD